MENAGLECDGPNIRANRNTTAFRPMLYFFPAVVIRPLFSSLSIATDHATGATDYTEV